MKYFSKPHLYTILISALILLGILLIPLFIIFKRLKNLVEEKIKEAENEYG